MFKSRKTRSGVIAVTAMLVTVPVGCMVGPDPTPPDLVMPDSWHTELLGGLEPGRYEPEAWWRTFDDPMLDDLIALAESRNLDLRIASSRIRQARAEYGIAASDLFPTVDTNVDANFSDGSRTSGGDIKSPSRYYTGTLDLGWEIDLWGRVRRSMEGAESEVQVQIENRRDALVSIRAEVALSYLEARTYQLQGLTLEEDVRSRKETLEIIEAEAARGTKMELEVLQFRAAYESAAAQLAPLEQKVAAAVNRISVLIGEAAGPLREAFRASMDPVRPIPQSSNAIAVGIPADAIRHRPDVRAAERTVMVAAAAVGVAEASLYPAFRITGTGGFASSNLDDWFTRSALGGVLGFEFSWPIFTGGRLQDVVKVRNEQSQQALLAYEATVLQAVAEVETALIAFASTLEERRRLRDTVNSYDAAMVLARDRFEAGVDDLQALLEVEREGLAAEQQLALAEGQVAANVVGLYKALGGAWNIEEKAIRASKEDSPNTAQETQG